MNLTRILPKSAHACSAMSCPETSESCRSYGQTVSAIILRMIISFFGVASLVIALAPIVAFAYAAMTL